MFTGLRRGSRGKSRFLRFCCVAETVEEAASDEAVAAVQESISRIGCNASMVEQESDNLSEVDEADCGEIGQYDIKLDGEYNIISMTRDS